MEGDDRLRETDASRRVLAVIRRESRVDRRLLLDLNLEHDLGFDSLQRIELAVNIERLLNIRLENNAASQALTIRDLLKEVERKQKASQIGAEELSASRQITWKEILSLKADADIAENYVLESRPMVTVINFIIMKLIFLLAKMLLKLDVQGRENLPRHGPYLICPNHQSYLDGVLITSALPYSVIKQFFSLGATPFFTGGFKGVLARLIKAVPIDPNTNLMRAMKLGAVGLKAKKVLLIFPEGGLTRDGELQNFKKGAAILARELQVPIIPVAIKGSFNVWSKVSDRIHLAQVKIAIGRPFKLEALHFHEIDKDYARSAQVIQDKVRNLLAVV